MIPFRKLLDIVDVDCYPIISRLPVRNINCCLGPLFICPAASGDEVIEDATSFEAPPPRDGLPKLFRFGGLLLLLLL